MLAVGCLPAIRRVAPDRQTCFAKNASIGAGSEGSGTQPVDHREYRHCCHPAGRMMVQLYFAEFKRDYPRINVGGSGRQDRRTPKKARWDQARSLKAWSPVANLADIARIHGSARLRYHGSSPRTSLMLRAILNKSGGDPCKSNPHVGECWLARSAGMGQKAEIHRETCVAMDGVLKAAKLGDSPLEPATRFHTCVHLKTAKTLDLDIPMTGHASAYEVIE